MSKKELARQLKAGKPEREPYPPRVLTCKIKDLKDAPSYLVVSEYLKVSPITAMRFLQGTEIKLTQALRLAKLLGKTVEELWEAK